MIDLYRHYARDGTLLYVGISLSALARLIQHRRSARWYRRIASVRIKKFPTREAAKAAEKIAIEKEKPLFNIQYLLEQEPARQPARPKRVLIKTMSLRDWCDLNGISTSTGRRILANGEGPQVSRLGERRIGVREDHNAEWQASRIREQPPRT